MSSKRRYDADIGCNLHKKLCSDDLTLLCLPDEILSMIVIMVVRFGNSFKNLKALTLVCHKLSQISRSFNIWSEYEQSLQALSSDCNVASLLDLQLVTQPDCIAFYKFNNGEYYLLRKFVSWVETLKSSTNYKIIYNIDKNSHTICFTVKYTEIMLFTFKLKLESGTSIDSVKISTIDVSALLHVFSLEQCCNMYWMINKDYVITAVVNFDGVEIVSVLSRYETDVLPIPIFNFDKTLYTTLSESTLSLIIQKSQYSQILSFQTDGKFLNLSYFIEGNNTKVRIPITECVISDTVKVLNKYIIAFIKHLLSLNNGEIYCCILDDPKHMVLVSESTKYQFAMAIQNISDNKT